MSSNKVDPRLNGKDLQAAKKMLDGTRKRIKSAAGGDRNLEFKLRRYVYIRLMHDERGNPAHRKALKKKKREEQSNLCALCKEVLSERGSVLDRFQAIDGYTMENTRLICHSCDRAIQADRRFT